MSKTARDRFRTWLLVGGICLLGMTGLLSVARAGWASAQAVPPATGWPVRQNVSQTVGESRVPAIAVDRRGYVHIVWEEGRYLYHSYWDLVQWSIPWRVTVGEQPSLAIDSNNVPHLLFVNEFRGKYQIYYCQWTGGFWSLPRNISNTSGVSAIPDIAIDSKNTLHFVWTDNSPGYNVIYHGRWTGMFSINMPIPQARGSVASLAIGGDDILHVVWQDRDSLDEPYEVYHTQYAGGSWSLPENLSDSDNPSTIPDIAVDRDGLAHITWEERVDSRDQVYYAGGRSFFWSLQEAVSNGSGDAYLPSIAVDGRGFSHIAWDQADQLYYRRRLALTLPWLGQQLVSESATGVADVVLAAGPDGAIHAAWAEQLPDGNWEIMYGASEPEFRYRGTLPLIVVD